MKRLLLATAIACLIIPASACTNSETDAVATTQTTTSEPSTTAVTADDDLAGFIDCVDSTPTVKPETITTDCINNSDPVKWMAWRIWNDKRAVGWGRLNGKKVVKIELSQPIETARGERVFSKITLDGIQLYR